jgi:hypothetical protein
MAPAPTPPSVRPPQPVAATTVPERADRYATLPTPAAPALRPAMGPARPMPNATQPMPAAPAVRPDPTPAAPLARSAAPVARPAAPPTRQPQPIVAPQQPTQAQAAPQPQPAPAQAAPQQQPSQARAFQDAAPTRLAPAAPQQQPTQAQAAPQQQPAQPAVAPQPQPTQAPAAPQQQPSQAQAFQTAPPTSRFVPSAPTVPAPASTTQAPTATTASVAAGTSDAPAPESTATMAAATHATTPPPATVSGDATPDRRTTDRRTADRRGSLADAPAEATADPVAEPIVQEPKLQHPAAAPVPHIPQPARPGATGDDAEVGTDGEFDDSDRHDPNRAGPFARLAGSGAAAIDPSQARRVVRDLRPIPDPRLDPEAAGDAEQFDPLTSDPYGSTRSARRFHGDDSAETPAPSPSDLWFTTADGDTHLATSWFGASRVMAMFDASRPLRIAATVMMAFIVIALLLVFLKSYTNVL